MLKWLTTLFSLKSVTANSTRPISTFLGMTKKIFCGEIGSGLNVSWFGISNLLLIIGTDIVGLRGWRYWPSAIPVVGVRSRFFPVRSRFIYHVDFVTMIVTIVHSRTLGGRFPRIVRWRDSRMLRRTTVGIMSGYWSALRGIVSGTSTGRPLMSVVLIPKVITPILKD